MDYCSLYSRHIPYYNPLDFELILKHHTLAVMTMAIASTVFMLFNANNQITELGLQPKCTVSPLPHTPTHLKHPCSNTYCRDGSL